MKTIYLVSCVSQKRDSLSPARELYTSVWFRKAREYVEQADAPWYILSAKYGLVDPDDQIEPYEKTLNNMPIAERREWAELVLEQLDDALRDVQRVVFLAGERYRKFLIEPLVERGIDVSVPMVGLPIGKQQAWLDRHTATH